MRIFF